MKRIANIACSRPAPADWPANRAFWEPPQTWFWRAPATQGLPRYAGVEIEAIFPGLRETLDANAYCEESGEDCTCRDVLLTATRKAFGAWHVSSGSDNSLPDDGLELKTAPASGEAFVRQVRAITNALAREDAEVDDTCGLHVHIDSQDFTSEDLYWLMQAWRAIQPAAMLLAPHSRRHGVYCRAYHFFPPLHEALLSVDKIALLAAVYQEPAKVGHPDSRSARSAMASWLGDSDLRELRRLCVRESNMRYNNARYRALNLHSHFYRRTIEFRLAPGTNNAAEIIGWARLYQAIIAWSQNRRAVVAAVRALHAAMDTAEDHAAQSGNESVGEAVARAARIAAARTAYHQVTEALGARWAGPLREFLAERWSECAPRWFARRRYAIAWG